MKTVKVKDSKSNGNSTKMKTTSKIKTTSKMNTTSKMKMISKIKDNLKN